MSMNKLFGRLKKMHAHVKMLWRRLFMPLAYGAISTSLILCAGCSKAPKEVAIALPPAALLEPIVIPDRSQAKTQGDLVRLLIEDEKTMERTNANLSALRRWLSVVEAGRNDD